MSENETFTKRSNVSFSKADIFEQKEATLHENLLSQVEQNELRVKSENDVKSLLDKHSSQLFAGENITTPKRTLHGPSSSRSNRSLLLSFNTPQTSFFTSDMILPPLPPSTPTEAQKLLLDMSPEPVFMTPRSIPKYTLHDLEKERSKLRTEIINLESQLRGRDAEINELRNHVANIENTISILEHEKNDLITSWEEERLQLESRSSMSLSTDSKTTAPAIDQAILAELETKHQEQLTVLANDLHYQYSQKHHQKVQALKANYEKKYEAKIIALEGKIEEMRKMLQNEQKEKREIIAMSEELMRVMEEQREKEQKN
ncbi:uncharacterized protein T551_02955 [Pneumocystis jirovecii RU7]|uniref:Uncharacterized protein n=1 Tax=Pneumocystis jirovecii (strain RU7) TaxID=1408657 RepID=A0A0W4ZGE7_PNEJ7|nr:uncharacterized protein T551_02955 [Pneumocystis jirovecii RU7]KTW27456.1 hypothetical protein T551_02955 [Pneumocystis jirovecii RU7]